MLLAATTLMASLGGYFLAGRNESRRDRRQAEQDRARADREQSAASNERKNRFQLDTLLELQDAVQLEARLTGRAMHFDHMQARESNYTQLPNDWSDEMHSNGVNVNRLVSRVLSDDLRDGVSRFTAACSAHTFLPKEFEELRGEELEDHSFRKMAAFGHQVNDVMDMLGSAIRLELTR
ncbi:hypothetical protein E3O47_07490 [Cryobacterium sp. TMT2-17-1]|nr:hypothetical protein E3N86_04590 [Cryobacterium sp. Hz7]TFC50842.1 hypothetical protein E3O47_07490 [Cryobacterium sp. TMT2-17-1]